jgi:RNA polymerase sigma-70 factor (ECF subfamily)
VRRQTPSTATRAEAAEPPSSSLGALYAEHQRFLWALSYRLTGCAADADDVVQATFVRALEHPPERTDEPWRPWLTKVALNLGRDVLRRRRRLRYVGPWLPSPIEAGGEAALASYEPEIASGVTTEGRYDMLESVSMAFLVALEALTPKQRAVLLLRDVFDYSVAETADGLGISEPDVKTTHHRARRAMRAYDERRCVPTRELQDRTRDAIGGLMSALLSGDTASAERLLASSVTALSDGGGEFFAARVPVVGRERVLKFYGNVVQRRGDTVSRVALVNGLPALVSEFRHEIPRQATRLVTCFTVDDDGRIDRIYSILATRKLTAVRFGG